MSHSVSKDLKQDHNLPKWKQMTSVSEGRLVQMKAWHQFCFDFALPSLHFSRASAEFSVKPCVMGTPGVCWIGWEGRGGWVGSVVMKQIKTFQWDPTMEPLLNGMFQFVLILYIVRLEITQQSSLMMFYWILLLLLLTHFFCLNPNQTLVV